MEQLGYRPGGRSRAATDEQTRTIALFYARTTPIPNELYERMISGVARTSVARQCRFVHVPLVGEPETWKALLEDRSIAGGLVMEPMDRALEGMLPQVGSFAMFF